jgi:hypothetical protein
MQQTKNKTTKSTNQKFNKPILGITVVLFQLFNTGCATTATSDDAIRSVLIKENVLIEKLKLERRQPAVNQGLSQSETLKSSEEHLLTSLDEIYQANEMLANELFNKSQMEMANGRIQQDRH